METEEEIYKKNLHCTKHYSCCKPENAVEMNEKVIRMVDNRVLIVKCNESFCKHMLLFGSLTICNCPIRIELFKSSKPVLANRMKLKFFISD